MVISARTRELGGGLFELAELGLQILKGFPAPVRAWRVVGEGAAEEPVRGVARGRPDAAGRARA